MQLTSLWSELRPGSDVVLTLEHLANEALLLREKMLNPAGNWESPFGDPPGSWDASNVPPNWDEHFKYEDMKLFRDRAAEKECVLGKPRINRILFTNVPNLFTSNKPVSLSATGKPEKWVDGVIATIDRELDAIERRRFAVLMFCAAAAAAFGALCNAGVSVIDVISRVISP
jgi:hypothetical protein